MIMNTKSNERDESNMKVEIQKALISIYNLTSNIKSELEMINDYTRRDGQLRTAVLQANETLSTVARDANIDVKSVLCDDDNDDDDETQSDSRNSLSSAMFQQNILALLNDM
ncbi:uncharacterized protein LOC108629891 [Ceratina calcarata]|uniref:Uncharacterized protein LOC108629891 n=1 Tax=Ceratina calcarata TaxID=156304 RepID=A0AAJ7S8T1_9HYME|nr:uncharacterized protein LOC108629891 [Ceratina calcarata]XP_026673466.1 uncharacterized protein LOC108629891 [Ceratina calcarata]